MTRSWPAIVLEMAVCLVLGLVVAYCGAGMVATKHVQEAKPSAECAGWQP